jgi:hypothetical protein
MEEHVTNETPAITPEQQLEILIPDLTHDRFRIGDAQFVVRMLPVFYEKVLLRLLGAQFEALDEKASLTTFMVSLVDKLPEIVAVICYEQGAKGAKRAEAWNETTFREIVAWIEQTACTADLMEIVKKQVEKNKMGDMLEGLLAQGQIMTKLGASLSTQR